jgi:hypothetical protein
MDRPPLVRELIQAVGHEALHAYPLLTAGSRARKSLGDLLKLV